GRLPQQYLIGVAGLILVLTSIYLVMPPRGRIRPRHALIGGIAVGLAVCRSAKGSGLSRTPANGW
ncbi:MAG: hypothetical protein WA753_16360, partial [Pseudolabrys sp.]